MKKAGLFLLLALLLGAPAAASCCPDGLHWCAENEYCCGSPPGAQCCAS